MVQEASKKASVTSSLGGHGHVVDWFGCFEGSGSCGISLLHSKDGLESTLSTKRIPRKTHDSSWIN